MKRFIAVLSGLLLMPAFAEVAPIYYDEIIEYNDEMIDEYEPVIEEVEEEENASPVVNKPAIVQRNVAGRSVSRAVAAGANNNSRANTNTRAVASSPRNAQQTQRKTISRSTKTQQVSARPQVTTRARATNASTRQQVTTRSRAAVATRSATSTARNATDNKPVTARVSANGNIISGIRDNNSIAAKTLKDSGDPLYISNSARIGTNRRSTTSRNSSIGASTPVITADNISDTTSTLDALAELTDYCKARYAQCMDNYCNVLDDNQGRCSCSGNIKKYETIELALQEASESFQDVVQKIKYIGLTASQIEALFTETEAELEMKSTSDTSSLRNSLENIKKKIIDVSGNDSTTSLLGGSSFDMSGLFNPDFSSTFDLNSFLDNSKVSNQRGTSLFNTATQRCKTAVLNSCVAQGIDANVVINSYDLAIDKQCIEYERSLNEANDEMRNNVRNAQNILQQARLLLAQQKNAYDLRGCVAALDECMQDEYVCGDDYELCLDPTGKYLANGEIVKGGIPGVAGGSSVNQIPVTATNITSWLSCGMYGLYSVWDYGEIGTSCSCTAESCPTSNVTNAWGKGSGENLNEYISEKTKKWETIYDDAKQGKNENDMATYLLRRVGYIDAKNDKSYGMCANVLKQCQDYTYETNGNSKKYIVNNEVIRQYLALALTKIKLQQDTILADYAETCWNDVYSCLSANNYDENNTNTTTSKTAVNACRSDISTCMSVTGYYPSDNTTLTLAAMTNWVASRLISCEENQFLDHQEATGGTGTQPNTIGTVSCLPCGWANCVNVTSESDVNASGCDVLHANGTPGSGTSHGIHLVSAGGQATSCTCPSGFTTIAKTNAGDGEPVSSGSSTTGYSTTIECKWNGSTP